VQVFDLAGEQVSEAGAAIAVGAAGADRDAVRFGELE
jgi:hypothetical protein